MHMNQKDEPKCTWIKKTSQNAHESKGWAKMHMRQRDESKCEWTLLSIINKQTQKKKEKKEKEERNKHNKINKNV
jgi:hypothetical protein